MEARSALVCKTRISVPHPFWNQTITIWNLDCEDERTGIFAEIISETPSILETAIKQLWTLLSFNKYWACLLIATPLPEEWIPERIHWGRHSLPSFAFLLQPCCVNVLRPRTLVTVLSVSSSAKSHPTLAQSSLGALSLVGYRLCEDKCAPSSSHECTL